MDVLAKRLAQGSKTSVSTNVLADRIHTLLTQQKRPRSIPEMERICSVPIVYPLTDEEVAAVQHLHVKQAAYEQGFRLQRVQAEALQVYEERGALFGPIAVGGGKTAISLRIVGMAVERGIRRVILFVPSQVLSQLVGRDIFWARSRVPIGCAFHVLGGKSRVDRLAMVRNNRQGCFILPYSLLQTSDTDELLETIQPQLMIFDEAHALKNRRAARTGRIHRYIKNHHPRVVALSGTITSKSIKQYSHIIQWCLGENSPLPLDAQVADDWATVLDATSEEWDFVSSRPNISTGPLRPMVTWSNKNFPHDSLKYDKEGFRRAYQNRLLTSPGVVSSPADSLGASLVFTNEKVPLEGQGSQELRDFTRAVEEDWVAPNGDEIEWAFHCFKWRYELSSGIYNNLHWPDLDSAKNITEDRLIAAKAHHLKLQEYHYELRSWLKYHQISGVDTPMLVGGEMARHGSRIVGENLYKKWKAAKDLEIPDMVERITEPVRVCPYKVNACIQWAKNHPEGGIIWYWHQGLGLWIVDEAVKQGLPVVHCPAGKQFNDFLVNTGAEERTKGKILVCSIAAHGQSKNLQYMSQQIFAQFPRPEDVAHQVVGRTHRMGQMADQVDITTLISTTIDEISLAATLNDAVYVYETTSSQRKLLIGTWNPMPIIHGQEVLARAGADAFRLNIRQRSILEDQFGS